jgi:hypothetical protein
MAHCVDKNTKLCVNSVKKTHKCGEKKIGGKKREKFYASKVPEQKM